tara:strand:+ start:92 stop:307 length:216 start_codon:yes stop_codon:yes gene_type:complete
MNGEEEKGLSNLNADQQLVHYFKPSSLQYKRPGIHLPQMLMGIAKKDLTHLIETFIEGDVILLPERISTLY